MESLDDLLADLQQASRTMRKDVHQSPSSKSSSSSSLPSQVYQTNYYNQIDNDSTGSLKSSEGGLHSPSYTGSGDMLRNRSSHSSINTASPSLREEPPVQQYYPGEDAIYEPQNIRYTSQASYNSNDKQAARNTLGNNLNELDMLLKDLNSAQFMTDMGQPTNDDRAPMMPKVPPPTAPKPTRKQAINRTNQMSPSVYQTDQVSPPAHSTNQISPSAYPYPTNQMSPTHQQLSPTTPSSATKELDDLMSSLTKFKMNASLSEPAPRTDDEPSYAQINKTRTPAHKPNELDSMLGNLESDMKVQGVSVDTKGLCAACSKPIVGQVITALGQLWHPEHFSCENCKEELGTRSFFERDGLPYCEKCNQELFAPMCVRCNTPIPDKLVTAMDATWHVDCFVCEHCGKMLHDEVFHERDGHPYCRADFFEMFAPKCRGCAEPIIEDFISTLDNHWHTSCFRCMDCSVSLPGGSFYDHEGLPYCETHYYSKRGSLCAGCQKPITGRCITAMFKKFHPEHFVCAFCLKQLNKGTFKEQNDKPYCHPCYMKLFA